jgi:hypothetical protein
MKLLFENWRKYVSESVDGDHLSDEAELIIHPEADVGQPEEEGGKDASNTLFFIKSAWGVKNDKWDHVGFILPNGSMKDMSGHRGDFAEPIISTWEDLMQDENFWQNVKSIPNSPEEAARIGIYKTMKLPQTVDVPDGIICRTGDPEKRSENCGSFVFNVLANAGLDPSFLKSDEYSVVGGQF